MFVNRINKYYIKEMKMFYLFNKEKPLEFLSGKLREHEWG